MARPRVNLGAAAVALATMAVLGGTPAVAQETTATGTLRGSGLLYAVQVRNTGTETIRCMAFAAASGVQIVTAAGPGSTTVPVVDGSTFRAEGFELAPGQTTTWGFTTRQRYPPDAGGILFVSADCRDDSPPIVATGPPAPGTALPVFGDSCAGRTVSGTVRRGSGRRIRRRTTLLPVPGSIDARDGTIALTVADGAGDTQDARVGGGRFAITQGRDAMGGFTTFRLTEPLARPRAGQRAAAAATRRRRLRVSTDGGRFQAVGHYAKAGATRPATWRITDTRRRTVVEALSGRIVVTSASGRSLAVRAPRRVVVRPR